MTTTLLRPAATILTTTIKTDQRDLQTALLPLLRRRRQQQLVR
jgi:TATA-binding protein-associated factor Taf7